MSYDVVWRPKVKEWVKKKCESCAVQTKSVLARTLVQLVEKTCELRACRKEKKKRIWPELKNEVTERFEH